MKTTYLKLGLCALMATILALTSHIYISEWMKPFIEQMARTLPAEAGAYPPHIMLAAYGTAFITLVVICFLYYQAGRLLNVSNRFLKALLVAAIILEVKGDLFRQPLMDLPMLSFYGC